MVHLVPIIIVPRLAPNLEERMTITRDKAIKSYLRETGFPTLNDALKEATFDSVCGGVCMLCGSVTDECEPDATNNWCAECDGQSVKSILVLGEVI